jgi:hypothetical protein
MKFKQTFASRGGFGASPIEDRRMSGPNIALKVRKLLESHLAVPRPKEKRAYDLCKKDVLGRGGSLKVVTTSRGTKVVVGSVSVDAGPVTATKLVKAGRGDKLETLLISRTKGLDEKVVDAVVGYGMGALEVSYRVDKDGNAKYVLRTNGSRACLEENRLNVAMALAGAAQIVEEMLAPKKEDAKEAEVVELKGRKAA